MRCFLDCSMESMGAMGDHLGAGTGSYENIFEDSEIQLPWQLTSIKAKPPFDKIRRKFQDGRYIYLP